MTVAPDSRLSRTIELIWKGWCVFCGVGVLSVAAAWAIVTMLASDGAVVRILGGPFDVTRQVRAGGELSYRIDFERLEACPGNVVYTFRSVDGGDSPAVVVLRRPVISLHVKSYFDARTSIELPPKVTPGEWDFEGGVDSGCPTRVRYDPLLKFRITVGP